MKRVTYVPGAILAGANHTLPAGSPAIRSVVGAQIQRLPASLADHPGADIAGALADHAVHAHDLITQGTGAPPAGGAIGLDATLTALEDAAIAALHTVPGGGATGVQNNAAAQTHTAGAAPVTHTGGNPVVAAVATRVNATQFTLDVDTLVGDLLTLIYNEEGEFIRAS